MAVRGYDVQSDRFLLESRLLDHPAPQGPCRGTLRQLPVVLLFLPRSCGDGGSARTDAGAVVPRRNMARHHDDSARSTGAQPGTPVSGTVTWTFEVVPQTNLQSFRTTIRSENGWLPITPDVIDVDDPGHRPAQISTERYDSPRGCRGTFGSFADRRGPQHSGRITRTIARCRSPDRSPHEGVTRWHRSTSAPSSFCEQPSLERLGQCS